MQNYLASFMNLVGPDLIVLFLIALVIGGPIILVVVFVWIALRNRPKAPLPVDPNPAPPASVQEPTYTNPNGKKHSGLGVASFVVSLAIGFAVCLLLLIGGIASARTGGMRENSPGTILFGFFMLGCLLSNLVGLGLGIAGLAQKERNRVFAVLGTTFNAASILGTLLLILIGNLME